MTIREYPVKVVDEFMIPKPLTVVRHLIKLDLSLDTEPMELVRLKDRRNEQMPDLCTASKLNQCLLSVTN